MLLSRIENIWIFCSVILYILILNVSGNIGVQESDSILHDFPGKDAPRKMPPMPKKQLPFPDPETMSEEDLLKWDQTAFSKRDRNNSGFIDVDEILQTMIDAASSKERAKLSRSNISPEQVQKRLDELLEGKEDEMRKTAQELLEKDDINKDGRVSLDEFSAARKLHFEEVKKRNEL